MSADKKLLARLKLSLYGIFSLGGSDSKHHLDRSLLLEETGTPVLMRRILYSFMFFTLVFIIWAASMKVNEVAVCHGEVIPRGSLQEMQHLEGGIVQKIHVDEGQFVKAGTLLVELDDSDSSSQLSETMVRMDSLDARLKRLNSFLDQHGNLKTNVKTVSKAGEDLNSEQTSILKQSIATLAAMRDVAQSQIDQLKVEMEELKIQQKTLGNQVKITGSELRTHLSSGNQAIFKLNDEKVALEEEMEIRETLVDKGYNSNVKFLNIQRSFFQLEKEIIEKKTQYEEKRHALEMSLSDLDAQYKKTPLLIKKKQAKIQELEKALLKEEAKIKEEIFLEKDTILEEKKTLLEASSRLKGVIARKKLYATIDGRILRIKPQKGSVLAPGSLVLSMVPDGVNLIAEVKISNHDIGHINVGDPVKLKFNTYDFARYGSMKGSLKEISPFTMKKENEISDEEGYYRGVIELTQNYLGKEKGIHSIFPGMTLQAEIVTGQKTVMEYILKPIYTSAQSALHER